MLWRRCPPGPGVCSSLGEPVAVEFDHDALAQPVQVLPFQSDTIEGFAVHAGDSWASITSDNFCDGATDDRVRVAFAAL